VVVGWWRGGGEVIGCEVIHRSRLQTKQEGQDFPWIPFLSFPTTFTEQQPTRKTTHHTGKPDHPQPPTRKTTTNTGQWDSLIMDGNHLVDIYHVQGCEMIDGLGHGKVSSSPNLLAKKQPETCNISTGSDPVKPRCSYRL